MKKTYKELGISSTYTYPSSEAGTYKKMTVSNTISSLNAISGDNNSMKECIYVVNNIGSNIKVIETCAFYECPNLKGFTAKSPLWSIGNCAFKNCTNLTSINLSCINGIGDEAFRYTNIQDLVLDLRSQTSGYEYEGCVDTDLNIGPHIGDYCFADNASLKSVNLKTSTELGQYMFSNCTSLTSVTFANHGQCVGRNAFSGCSSLKEIHLPENFEVYSQQMFENCTELTTVAIPHSASKFDTVETSAFIGCTKLNSIVLPPSLNSMDNIQEDAFKNTGLTSITLMGISSDVLSTYVARITYTSPTKFYEQYSDFKYGTWYGTSDHSKRSSELAEKERKMIKAMKSVAEKYHVPFFFAHCSPGCGRCTQQTIHVLKNKKFQNWMSEQPYLFFYGVQWDSYQSELFKGGILLPTYYKYWKKDDGTVFEEVTQYPDVYPGINTSQYAQNVIEFIPKGFEGYTPVQQFQKLVEPENQQEFSFWGINDDTLVIPGDYATRGHKYKYVKSKNWLEEV